MIKIIIKNKSIEESVAPIPKEVQARIDYCYGKTPTGRTANRMKANYKKREKK